MKSKPKANLDSPYSSPAKRIRAILQEGSAGESKISELTISRIEKRDKTIQYSSIARRLNVLFKSKISSYYFTFIRKLADQNKHNKLKQRISLGLFVLIVGQSQRRNKTIAFGKLRANGKLRKSSQEKRRLGINILTYVMKQKRRINLLHVVSKMRINFDNTNIINPKNSGMRTPKAQKQKDSTQPDQQLSLSLINPLKQLIAYDSKTFVDLTLTHLKTPLQIQVKKISDTKDLKGQKLLLMVLNNHVKAIIDLKDFPQLNGNLNPNNSIRRSFNEKTSVAMYEELGNQFFEGDQQLHKLIIISNDFGKAQGIIQLAIKNYTSKNYRFRTNKLVESRIRLLEIILSVLRSADGKSIAQKQVPPILELRHQGPSFKQLEVSHVRLIVEELDQKVYELSTISEQIPQLQTFKRTLDLTMPEHNTYLTKIVDVLIELHHKVNKLISRRPQKLLREIEAVEQQCLIIEIATSEFLDLIHSQTEVRIKPIYFDQRKNNSPDYFRKIQKNVVKLSEAIIEQIAIGHQARDRINQIKAMIEVFWNLLAGMQEYEREWKQYRDRQDKTQEQQQILQLLDLCLKFVNDKIEKMNEDFEFERQALIDGNNKNIQYLEEDLDKFARENEEQRAIIEDMERQIVQLSKDAQDWQLKYKDLVRKNEDWQTKYKDLLRKSDAEKRSGSSLQGQIVQKQNIIAEMKRIIAQLQQKQSAMLTQQQNYLNLRRFADELEDKLREKDQYLKNKEKQYQNILLEIQEKNTKIRELDVTINVNSKKLIELQSQSKIGVQDKNRIRDLEFKLANYEKNYGDDAKKLRQLQLKLANAQRDARRTTQLEGKLSNLERELRTAQDQARQSNRNKDTSDRKIRQLEIQINNLRIRTTQSNQSEQALREARLKLEKLNDLERELRAAKDQIARLKRLESEFNLQNNKIINLQASINERNRRITELESNIGTLGSSKDQLARLKKIEADYSQLVPNFANLQATLNIRNRKITQLQARVRSLEYQVGNLTSELTRQRSLIQELKLKQRELISLQQERVTYESSRVNGDKVNEYLKQIQYLKEKVRSLQDLIDIFTQEHGILEAKIKQYRLREGTFKTSVQKYDKLFQDYNILVTQLKTKEEQFLSYKRAVEQQKSMYTSSVQKYDQTIARQKTLEREINELRNQLTRSKFDETSARERISSLEREIRQLRDLLNKQKSEQASSKERIFTLERQITISREQITKQKGSDSTTLERISSLEREIGQLRDQLFKQKTRFEVTSLQWTNQQKILIQQINRLRLELQKYRLGQTQQFKDEGKYYLRVKGQRLESLIKIMQEKLLNGKEQN